MKILIVGAGTIGLTYGWILSSIHEVTMYIRKEKEAYYRQGFDLHVNDLRPEKVNGVFHYAPKLTTELTDQYDLVIVTVDRTQLEPLLHKLKELEGKTDILFMLNHWNLKSEVERVLSSGSYLVGFPSQIGGGREENRLNVIVFNEGTVLGVYNDKQKEKISEYQHAFGSAGLCVEIKDNIFDWLKVHYLQQSLSAGAILKAGSYASFAGSYRAILEMVYAFREGVDVCTAYGVQAKKIFPASMFRYPAPLVALAMKSMFNKPETTAMITGHMKHGMAEWITGYKEVLQSGESKNLPMDRWRSYQKYIDG